MPSHTCDSRLSASSPSSPTIRSIPCEAAATLISALLRPRILAARRYRRGWRGWRDGHLGHTPEALLPFRTEESFRTRAPRRIADTTVATVDGEIAGFIMVVGDEVEQVYVARPHRGTGLADRLLAEAVRQVRSNGHPEAWLAVATGNARARRFYERAGWTDTGPFDYPARTPAGLIPVPCHRYVKSAEPPGT
ncbi:MAG: GNAT family N-acetyltransferase [Thermoanaerobaculia bacterium]